MVSLTTNATMRKVSQAAQHVIYVAVRAPARPQPAGLLSSYVHLPVSPLIERGNGIYDMYVYMCVYIYIYIYVYTHLCVYVYVYVCIYIYIYTYVHIHACVCIHACVYIYIYIYTLIMICYGVRSRFHAERAAGSKHRARLDIHTI